MKKKKYVLCFLTSVIVFTFSGCGTKLYDLTDIERSQIVSYAADALSKYNVYQKDGTTAVNKKELEAALAPVEESQKEETETQADTENNYSEISELIDEQKDLPAEGETTIASMLSLPDTLTLTYNGYSTGDYYTEGGAYSLSAKSGKVFVVASFTLSASADSQVDFLSQDPKFKITVNDRTISQEVTYLLDDLSTYQGNLSAGTSVDLVLLFQISEDEATDLGNLQMKLQLGQESKTIALQ